MTIGGTHGISERRGRPRVAGSSTPASRSAGRSAWPCSSAIATAQTNSVLDAATGRPDLPAALTEGFQAAFLAGAALSLAGAVVAAVMIRRSDSRSVIGQAADAPVAA